MSEEVLPPLKTKAVHKNDHAKTKGPVWEVTGHERDRTDGKPIRLDHAKHKMNDCEQPQTRHVSPSEFQQDYVQL